MALKEVPRKAYYLATKVNAMQIQKKFTTEMFSLTKITAMKLISVFIQPFAQVGRYELEPAEMFDFTRDKVLR